MDVHELTREQLSELKNAYAMDLANEGVLFQTIYGDAERDKAGEFLSYGEMLEIDSIISDEDAFEYYDGVDFVEDDFFGSCEEDIA